MKNTKKGFYVYPDTELGSLPLQRLTDDHYGKFWRLRLQCWMDHGLPNDHDKLAWMLGCSRLDFDNFWRFVSPLFIVTSTGELYDMELWTKWNNLDKRAETSTLNGAKGGRPTKTKRNLKKPNVNLTEPNQNLSKPILAGAGEGKGIGIGNGSGNGRTVSLTRDQLLDGWFEKTWKDHPRKVGKEEARAAYKKLFGKTPDSSFAFFIHQALLREVPRYKKLIADGNEESVKHFSAYLNAGRHMDHEEALRPAVEEFRRKKIENKKSELPLEA